MKAARLLLLSIDVLICGFAVNGPAGEPPRGALIPSIQRTNGGPTGIKSISVRRSFALTAEDEAKIKEHIANLARINRPDFGLSATMGGTAFAPVPGSGEVTGGFLLTNHGLDTASDFRELVALGPRALPFLLARLDDATPTKLVHTHPGGFGGMFLAAELDINETNSVEKRAAARLPKPEHMFENKSLDSYTVKVGDVCFTIVGQIVGRGYQAIRYQPTAIVIINSPVESKPLANAVRDIWSGTNAAQQVLDSLLIDYYTAEDRQPSAARRMVYYFPDETAGMIAERLRGLDVRRTHKMDGFSSREKANGVRTEDLIKALAWTRVPEVEREVLAIFKRTSDPALFLAALPGISTNHNDLAISRLNDVLDGLPADEPGPYGHGYYLLVAFGERFPDRAEETFARYLTNAGVERWRTMAMVLRNTLKELAPKLLGPALLDKRECGWTYALVPGQNEPRRPLRVCDEAATTISSSRPDLHFRMAGEHSELDKQIRVIMEQLGNEPMPR